MIIAFLPQSRRHLNGVFASLIPIIHVIFEINLKSCINSINLRYGL